MSHDTDADALRAQVRSRYAKTAEQVQTRANTDCCDASCCQDSVITRDLYTTDVTDALPESAVLASLGCGNPTALIDLHPGERVLDLGSGGGIDVLLSAKRVGPTGLVFGLDMTDEMLALALHNQRESGLTNVAFLRGHIEAIPLPTSSVDVVISNCVINLAADKSQVLREAFRVLSPGGRFAVSDVIAEGPVPPALRQNMEAWVGCLAGALEQEEYVRLLQEVGFTDITVTITRRYTASDAGIDTSTLPADWEASDGKLASAFVRANKPQTSMSSSQSIPLSVLSSSPTSSCCSPSCCQ